MLISHNWLKGYFTNKELVPAPDKVAELFTMRAFEVESVEEKDGDTIYDLKLTADRAPYAYALRYVALELALLVPELILSPEVYNLYTADLSVDGIAHVTDSYLVDSDVKDDCQMYSLTKIEDVANTTSPDWVKMGIEILGQQSRGTVVDLTNFVMFDSGQPLHAFDADKVEGQIHVGKSLEGEKITILGGKEIALPTGTLVIRDDKDILAIAGVKGGVKAEVDSDTKNIYLEAAHFNSVKVRRTARGLNLLNDSSKRFEQNLTAERFLVGQQTYAHMIKYAFPDAKVGELTVSADIKTLLDTGKLRKISVDIASASVAVNKEDSRVPALLREFLENILPKTGAKVEKKDDNTYIVTQPHYRSDLVSQADVVDEFLRNKGYDFLEYVEPKKDKVEGLKENMDKLEAVIRDYFVNAGFDEVKLHTLVDNKEQWADVVSLDNSLTAERDTLRNKLSVNLGKVLEYNIKHLDLVSKDRTVFKDEDKVKLFEIGNVFTDAKPNVIESNHLSFGVGVFKWPKGENAVGFINTICIDLMNIFNIEKTSFGDLFDNSGNTSELDLQKLKKLVDSNMLDNLVKNISRYKSPEEKTYKKASIYPAMSRDIAFFGSQNKEDVDLFMETQAKKSDLIENHFCFDKFPKEDKTSYAYRFVFQSYEKTLTEEEVGVIMNQIATAVTAQGWMVR